MARSGGTIICRCLASMERIVLLSEIHPLGARMFNPLDQAVSQELVIPLYYTGIETLALLQDEHGTVREAALDRHFRATVVVDVPANGRTWCVVRSGDDSARER